MYAYIYICPYVSLHPHMLCSLHAYYLDDMLFEGYPRLALFTCFISLHAFSRNIFQTYQTQLYHLHVLVLVF
jgi:hypothetical protein